MSQTNNCALKKVVNSPALWPASLNKPIASVTSYVFKSQEHTQKFVKFMKEKLPRVEVKVSRDDKNFYIVNLTNLTKGCKDGQNAGNDTTLNCKTICSKNVPPYYSTCYWKGSVTSSSNNDNGGGTHLPVYMQELFPPPMLEKIKKFNYFFGI